MFMKSLLAVAAAGGMLLAASAANATVTTYTTASAYMGAFGGSGLTTSVSDPVDWGAFANSLQIANPDNATVPNNSSMLTSGANGGENVKISSGNNSTFTTYLDSSGGHWKGDFANNTYVLFTAGTSMTLSFSTAVTGVGLDLQTLDTGAYQFQIQAYNSANVALGTLPATSTSTNSTGASIFNVNNEGKAAFAGVTSTAADISYVTITLVTDKGTAVGPLNQGTGFSIDTSLIYHLPISQSTGNQTQTPEPGTLALLGGGLAALGAVRRRRNRAA